jgi:prepilin-type N-terminal cleavage/methylation domain-containing protein
MSAPTAPDSQAGFTLAELLVALALTAALASSIIAAFHLVRRASAISYDRENTEAIDAAARQLRGLLARTIPATTIDEADGTARPVFAGRPDTVTFVTLSEATAFQGGQMRVRLAWQGKPPSAEHPSALILQAAVFRANPRLVIESEPVILFRNVVRFQLRYFGSPEPDQPSQWHSEWLGRERMPLAVLAHIDLAGRSSTRQLTLQSTLRLAAAN